MNDTTILATIDAHPQLQIWGHGMARGHTYDFATARAELTHPSILNRIDHAARWCQDNLVAAKAVRHQFSGYHWKHVYERETRKYIETGAFLVAALHAGLPVTLDHFNGTIHVRLTR